MKKESYQHKYMSTGMALGMFIGSIISMFTGFPIFNIAILIGMGIGAFIGKSRDDNNKGE